MLLVPKGASCSAVAENCLERSDGPVARQSKGSALPNHYIQGRPQQPTRAVIGFAPWCRSATVMTLLCCRTNARHNAEHPPLPFTQANAAGSSTPAECPQATYVRASRYLNEGTNVLAFEFSGLGTEEDEEDEDAAT